MAKIITSLISYVLWGITLYCAYFPPTGPFDVIMILIMVMVVLPLMILGNEYIWKSVGERRKR